MRAQGKVSKERPRTVRRSLPAPDLCPATGLPPGPSPELARLASVRLDSRPWRGLRLFHSPVRSDMPIPGCVVRRSAAPEFAQSARFVNRVQCQGRFGGSRDRNRPVAMGDMPVGKSERSSQRLGVARTVMLMPGRAARVCGDRHGTGGLTLGSGVLPLSLLPCEPESSAGRNDSIQYRSESTYRLTRFLQVPRNRSAQFPGGVGSSRPLVSLTSGAGGASSPAMAGVISAGTEAIVAAGFIAWYVCWPAPSTGAA